MVEKLEAIERPLPEPGLVLIVDDEAPIVDILEYLIEDLGHTPLSAQNGKAALQLVQHRWPALVMTDLMMPFVSGTQLIAEMHTLAQRWGLVPPTFIVLTAADPSTVTQEGIDVIIRKPFEVPEVETLLRRFLADTYTK